MQNRYPHSTCYTRYTLPKHASQTLTSRTNGQADTSLNSRPFGQFPLSPVPHLSLSLRSLINYLSIPILSLSLSFSQSLSRSLPPIRGSLVVSLSLPPAHSLCCCVLGYAVQIPPLGEIMVIEVMEHCRNRIREYGREKGQCPLIEFANSISGLSFQDLLKYLRVHVPSPLTNSANILHYLKSVSCIRYRITQGCDTCNIHY